LDNFAVGIATDLDVKAEPRIILPPGEYQSEPGKLGQVVGNLPEIGATDDFGLGGGNWFQDGPALEITCDLKLMDQAQDFDSHFAAVDDRGDELGVQELGLGRLDFVEEVI